MVYIIPRIFIPYGKSHIRPQIPSSQVSTTTSTSDGKSSRKKEDEEEMDKTRQQPTTKGDKTRKQPGTEIRRLQVIDKTKDDGKILTFFKRNIKVGFKQLLFTFSHIGTLVIRKNPMTNDQVIIRSILKFIIDIVYAGGKDVTCVTINKLRDLCSAVNQIRQEGLCSAVNQITSFIEEIPFQLFSNPFSKRVISYFIEDEDAQSVIV
ncbi:hypothetical protein GQR58_004857 [Nymphon striatum]|nr:hypothetical protein GQR58_004857 [Nymphon striatum]